MADSVFLSLVNRVQVTGEGKIADRDERDIIPVVGVRQAVTPYVIRDLSWEATKGAGGASLARLGWCGHLRRTLEQLVQVFVGLRIMAF